MLHVCIVIYNFLVEEYKLLHLQTKFENKLELIFLDNSDQEELQKANEWFCDRNHYVYLPMGGNQGLSYAYNRAISYLNQKYPNGEEWMMTLDDDTYLSDKYFENIIRSIEENSGRLIKSGIIKTDTDILSPWKVKNRYKKIDKPGVYHDIACINSGLTMKVSLLNRIGGYSEELFLDTIDWYLFYKFREASYCEVEIVNGEIRQQFSGSGFAGYKRDLKRFRIYSKDYLKYLELCSNDHTLTKLGLYKRALRLSLHYRKNFFKYLGK